MTRTPTLPLTDKKMWRDLLALAHPDSRRHGSHELFIWTQAVKDHVLAGVVEKRPESEGPRRAPRYPDEERERVPYLSGAYFAVMTQRAVAMADEVPFVYANLLRLLRDRYSEPHLYRQQERGASYKQLAFIAHLAGMDKNRRITWYRIAEQVPLSDRHAGHILSCLKRRAA